MNKPLHPIFDLLAHADSLTLTREEWFALSPRKHNSLMNVASSVSDINRRKSNPFKIKAELKYTNNTSSVRVIQITKV